MADLKSLEIERIGGSERIAALDVLRGVAILCILFMNIPDMGSFTFIVGDPRLPTWSGFDRIAWWLQTAAFSGTQRGLLELLFGAGILIMARRAMEPDGPVAVADLHFRRNLLLCAFGLFNAFVLMWYGDILLTYGLAALVLFPFRMLKPRALIAWALAIFAAMFLLFQLPNYRSQLEQKATYEQVEAATAAHRKVSAEDKKAADEYRERLTAFRTLPMQQPKTIEKVKKV
jgi:uncharacterized protein